MNRIAFLASLGLALVACRGGNTSGDDVEGPDAPKGPVVAKIPEIQNDMMAPGTAVEVKGVVITAIDTYGSRTGDLWVQETAGGPFSGVKVFGAPLDALATLKVGDLVDISGAVKDEFALNSDSSMRKVTELKPAEGGMLTITAVGTGTVPAPATVDAAMLAGLSKTAREAEWEKWEGVLITVTNARQLSAVDTFGSNPGDDSNEFRISGIARVQSTMAALPANATVFTCYQSITGIGDYFFNDIVSPRSTSDLVAGGTGCIPMATSVVMIQSATTKPEVVNLTNVYVTGRDDIGDATKNNGFWVADALQGAASNGVYVYTGAAADAGLVLGAKIATLTGSVDEFDLGANMQPPMGDTLTEISNPKLGAITAPAGGPQNQPAPATSPTVATLRDIGAAGEVWEGVLVRIGPVKVTSTANASSRGQYELTANTNDKIILDDDAFKFTSGAPTMNACLQVTGIMSLAIFDDLRTINPRSAADVTTTTGCN